jgi:hypothetical protein
VKIAHAMGVKGYAEGITGTVDDKGHITYPDDKFDIIWRVDQPYNEIDWVGSENIPGLDN